MATDEILLAYQELGLKDCPADTNIEAAIKLLVERGHIDANFDRYFINDDFSVDSNNSVISVHKSGPLLEPEYILLADATQNSVGFEEASIETFGKLQNLANGQAFAQNYPGAQQQLSVAEKLLIHLDDILNRFKGEGNQILETNNYQLQREGKVVTLIQPTVGPNGDMLPANDPRSLLLKGEVCLRKGHAILSYLSTTDILRISHAYQSNINLDTQEILYQLNTHVPEYILPNINFIPVSLNEMQRSWTLPKGGVKTRKADMATTLATYESALALVNTTESDVFGTDDFVIIKDEDHLIIKNGQGTIFFEHSSLYITVVPSFIFSTEGAYHIMEFCQHNLSQILASTISYSRAQELLRYTQYFNLEEGQYSTIDNDYTIVGNGDIVQIFDQDNTLVLSGNRITDQILENCISERLTAKIIEQSIHNFNSFQEQLKIRHATPAMRFALAVSHKAVRYIKDGDTVLSHHLYENIVNEFVPDSIKFGSEPYPGPEFIDGITLRELWDEWEGFDKPQPNYDLINWNFIEPFKTTIKTAELIAFENTIEKEIGAAQGTSIQIEPEFCIA